MDKELSVVGSGSKSESESFVSKGAEVNSLHTVVKNYLYSLRDILEAAGIAMPHMAQWLKNEMSKTGKKIERFLPEAEGQTEIVFHNARDFVEFSHALNSWKRLDANKSMPLLARSLFMQIFCEFDAFMGRLLKEIYIRNFDLMRGISREISLVDLLGFEDIESARRAMLEKEIDSFRRDGYVEQFTSLEKKFSLQLKKFPEWGEFVEFGQRRNLFAHNDGLVSEQYLAICRRESCNIHTSLAVGDQLVVKPEDLRDALRVISKVGYMLCHTLWSKVFPKEIEVMHQSLNSILYESLVDKRWKIAADLGAFALTDPMRKSVAEIDFRLRLINTAIAKKFSGDDAGSRTLIGSLDWSASYRDFKLAILILHDNFEDAIALMRQIGKSGEMLNQQAYHSWPLFEKFREREDFYAVYKEIYGEAYESESGEVSAKISPEVKSVKQIDIIKEPATKITKKTRIRKKLSDS